MKRFKTINIFLICLLVVSLALSGCSKDKAESETPAVSEEGNEIAETENDEVSKEDTDKDELEKEDEEAETDDEEENNEYVEEDPEESSVGEGTSFFEGEVKGEKVPEEERESDVQGEAETEGKGPEEGINILKVEGKVNSPLSLTLDELKSMEDLIFEGDFYSLNNFGTTQHTHFKGVNLWGLLQKAQITSDAAKVRIVGKDTYEMEFTVEEVKRQDYIDETSPDVKLPMIIAWQENGEEYDPEEGPPFKLVVGQKEPGDVNKPQWVSNIAKIIVE